MNESTSHLIQSLAALVGLLAVTIVFAAMHDSAHAGEALAAFVGYAAGSRTHSRALASAAPVVAAGAAALLMSGCSGVTAQQGATIGAGIRDFTCWGAAKICEATGASDACDARAAICHALGSEKGDQS